MSIVPANMRYQSGGKPVALASSRRVVIVTPEGGTSGYTPDTNGTIRIDLAPSLGFLDTHNSFLQFRLKTKEGTVDHAKECRLDENSMSWVRTFTIYSSTGSQLEHIENYGLLVNLMHKTTSPDDYKHSIGQMIDNTGSRAVRNAAMAHPKGSMFNSGFDCSGILSGSNEHLLPLSFMQGPLTIELTLDAFKNCFVGTSTSNSSASYVIDNVEYHANVLSADPSYNAKFSQQLRERGIDMSFSTYKTHNTTLPDANSVDLSISQNAASVKGVYHVLRDSAKYQSAEYDSLSTYKSGGLKECQWDLGGMQYPQTPLKLQNDGVTNTYSHGLMSFNMFRNHALGCSVDDTNYWSTEASAVSQGLPTSAYKALPVRRIYGTWVANSKVAYTGLTAAANITQDAASKVLSAASVTALTTAINSRTPTMAIAAGQKNPLTGLLIASNQTAIGLTHMVPTLTFVPDNARDLPLLEMGMRCKMGVSAALQPQGEVSSGDDTPISGPQGAMTNLDDADMGLDRFFSKGPAVAPAAYTENTQYKAESANVLYAGAPSSVSWGHTAGSGGGANAVAERYVAGIGIPFVDGKNRPVMSKRAAVGVSGWVDAVPDDTSFWIGNSFETHQESPELISGSDLTNATPLHVRLEYEGTSEGDANFFEGKSTSDPFTSFVHIDAVLRLQPDGTLISSV